MGWEEEHRLRVVGFPDAIQQAHAHSSNHRGEVIESSSCGCFYCCAVFPPSQIEEWVDEVHGEGQTALCPRCGVDSVLGNASGVPIESDFLAAMKAYWF